MAAAVPAHRELRERLGRLVGPFVVPAGRLDELSAHLDAGPAFDVSLIARPVTCRPPRGGSRTTRGSAWPRSRYRPSPTSRPPTRPCARSTTSLPAAVPAAVELPRTAALDAVLDVLAGTRYRAKLRTGGVRAELFPSAAELAATLHACVARDVAFKCTAGLHHAVRHTDPATGLRAPRLPQPAAGGIRAVGRGATADRRRAPAATSDAGGMVAALRTWPPQPRRPGPGAVHLLRHLQRARARRRPRRSRPAALPGSDPRVTAIAQSWLDLPPDTGFGLGNLPYGVFSTSGTAAGAPASRSATACSTWPPSPATTSTRPGSPQRASWPAGRAAWPALRDRLTALAHRPGAPGDGRAAPRAPGRGDDAPADRGGRLRRLLQLPAPRGEPRPDVPAGLRAADPQLEAPADRLPRPRRHGADLRHAGGPARRGQRKAPTDDAPDVRPLADGWTSRPRSASSSAPRRSSARPCR